MEIAAGIRVWAMVPLTGEYTNTKARSLIIEPGAEGMRPPRSSVEEDLLSKIRQSNAETEAFIEEARRARHFFPNEYMPVGRRNGRSNFLVDMLKLSFALAFVAAIIFCAGIFVGMRL